MTYRFSNRLNEIHPSMIRTVLNQAQGPDMINFSPGFPDINAFPITQIQQISQILLKEDAKTVLEYARTVTFDCLKQVLIPFFNRRETLFKSEDDLMATSGSQEGLEMAAKVFLNDGDVIVAEDPAFVGALNAFKSNGASIVGIPLEADGMNLNLLEKSFQSHPKPKLLYMIPTFQNPTTICTSLEKRKAIYELCLKYQVYILEDNPYGDLYFNEPPCSSMKAIDEHGIVIYFTSFSKIIAPGLRVGIVIANQEIISRFNIIKQASDGAVTNYSQLLIARLFEEMDINVHLDQLRDTYRTKGEWMYQQMRRCFHPRIHVPQPQGGMFIWIKLPDEASAQAFFDQALACHIAIVPEKTFAIDEKRTRCGFRFSYSCVTLKQIEEGIQKLGKISYSILEK